MLLAAYEAIHKMTPSTLQISFKNKDRAYSADSTGMVGEVFSMDAGFVNGLNSMTASALPKFSTSTAKEDSSSVTKTANNPIIDTVEISSQSQSTPRVFDPTATDGPYEQKHIGGPLATSSAVDGYDGWAAMLKYCFGAVDGVPCGSQNKEFGNNPPVIPYWRSDDKNYSATNGYIPANTLTHEERNLIANLLVYSHDHGMSDDGATLIASCMISYAKDGHKYGLFNDEYKKVTLSNLAADRTEWGPERISNRDTMVQAFREGRYNVMGSTSRDDKEALTMDAVAVRTLSSQAAKDSLISDKLAGQVFVLSMDGGGYNTLQHFEDIEKLVYAYSQSHPNGGENSGVSAEAQKYMSYRNGEIAARHDLEAEAKLPPKHHTSDGKTDAVASVLADLGGKPGLAPTEDDRAFFDKYSERVGYVLSSLDETQKSTLGMLYKMAAQKGTSAALVKVDQLAGAMAALNYMNKMVGSSPNTADAGNFWTQMLQRNQNSVNAALRDALQKRLNQAATPVKSEE